MDTSRLPKDRSRELYGLWFGVSTGLQMGAYLTRLDLYWVSLSLSVMALVAAGYFYRRGGRRTGSTEPAPV